MDTNYCIFGIVRNFQLIFNLHLAWGHFEWSGRWSDHSEEWKKNPGMKEKLSQVCANDGMFFMCLEDFISYWDRLEVVCILQPPSIITMTSRPTSAIIKLRIAKEQWNFEMCHGEWKNETAGGIFGHNIRKSRHNPQFLLSIGGAASNVCRHVIISLMQKSRRSDDKKEQNFCIGFHVMRRPRLGSHRLFSFRSNDLVPVTPGLWEWGREVSGEVVNLGKSIMHIS
jgi:hypothetical protein